MDEHSTWFITLTLHIDLCGINLTKELKQAFTANEGRHSMQQLLNNNQLNNKISGRTHGTGQYRHITQKKPLSHLAPRYISSHKHNPREREMGDGSVEYQFLHPEIHVCKTEIKL